jgi:hypothetical protein
MIEVSEKGDTADAVETAIDRSKADERLTWAELVNETRLRTKPKDGNAPATQQPVPSRTIAK